MFVILVINVVIFTTINHTKVGLPIINGSISKPELGIFNRVPMLHRVMFVCSEDVVILLQILQKY